MTDADYYTGALGVLAVVVALAIAAIGLRVLLAPTLRGAPARLVEAVVGCGIVVVVAELLGTVGAFGAEALVVATSLVAVGVVVLVRARPPARSGVAPAPDLHPAWARPAALVVSAAAVVQWVTRIPDAASDGITQSDSLLYHLPFAARFAESGGVSHLHAVWFDPTYSFFPQTGELLHAVGMLLTGRDFLSTSLNLVWLGLALLAGWCLGSRWGVGHLTLTATAALFATPVFVHSQPGAATTDAAATALLLAALALVAHADGSLRLLAVAGLAGGLAAGTKVTVLGSLVGVTVVLVVTTRSSWRWVIARTWAAGLLVGGGYWYLRNLFRTGSPVPLVDVPGLSSPYQPLIEAYGRSIIDYVGDGQFWREVVPDGLRDALGRAYPATLVGAAVALADSVRSLRIRRPDAPDVRDASLRRIRLALIVAALAGVALYVFTPTSAYGPEGNPFGFAGNVRYAYPGLVCALALVGFAAIGRPRWLHAVLMALLAAAFVAGLATGDGGNDAELVDHPEVFAVAVAGALMVALAGWLAGSRGVLPRGRFVLGAAAVLVLLVGGALGAKDPVDRYLDRRYRDGGLGEWARSVHDARIGMVGVRRQLPLAGLDLSNEVTYIGRRTSGGGFTAARSCEEMWAFVVAGEYDFVVTGEQKLGVQPAPEDEWIASGRAARLVARAAPTDASRAIAFQIDDAAATAPRCP